MSLSVTQVETVRRCARLYWYRYVSDLPKPAPTPAMLLGTAGHKVLENRHTGTGIVTPVIPPAILTAVRRNILYPPKTPKIYAEGQIIFDLFEHSWKGFVDIRNESGRYLDPQGRWTADPFFEVLDYKFNRHPKYWKTASDLRDDVQMSVYAHALYPDIDIIRLSHVSFETQYPFDVRKVTVLQEQTIRERVLRETVYPAVRLIEETREHKTVDNTEYDTRRCRDYGGCPYENICTKRKGVNVNPIQARLAAMAKSQSAPKSIPPTPAPARARPPAPAGFHYEGTVLVPDEAPETPAEEAVVEKEAAESPAAAAPSRALAGGIRLFVDVIAKAPRLELESLDQYTMEVMQRIADHMQVEDIRTAETGALAFGRWRAFLISAIRAALPGPGDYLITGARGSDVKQAVIEAIEPYADLIVSVAG